MDDLPRATVMRLSAGSCSRLRRSRRDVLAEPASTSLSITEPERRGKVPIA